MEDSADFFGLQSSVAMVVEDLEEEEDDVYVISATAYKVIVEKSGSAYVRLGIIDAGSNIQLATYQYAMKCGRPIQLETRNRRIGTAEQEGSVPIFGWIDVGGYIGKCQSRGLGCDFPPLDAQQDDLVCLLYTYNSDGVREDLQEIELDDHMQLYLVDVNSLSDIDKVEYVSQMGDYVGPNALLGGSLGTLCHSLCGVACAGRLQDFDENDQLTGKEAVVASLSKRKHQPSHDMCRRVWNLHENLGHAEMRNVAQQIVNGDAGEVDVDAREIDLVIAHQHCLSCAIAKWVFMRQLLG